MNGDDQIPEHATPTEHAMTAFGSLTLRDYFAAAALSGVLKIIDTIGKDDQRDYDAQAAKYSYRVADAMLAIRKG